jgi:hypothetical protein
MLAATCAEPLLPSYLRIDSATPGVLLTEPPDSSLSLPPSQKVEEALDRDANPIREAVKLVADLVESLLDREEFDQGLGP